MEDGASYSGSHLTVIHSCGVGQKARLWTGETPVPQENIQSRRTSVCIAAPRVRYLNYTLIGGNQFNQASHFCTISANS
jgi:hypothetical protein